MRYHTLLTYYNYISLPDLVFLSFLLRWSLLIASLEPFALSVSKSHPYRHVLLYVVAISLVQLWISIIPLEVQAGAIPVLLIRVTDYNMTGKKLVFHIFLRYLVLISSSFSFPNFDPVLNFFLNNHTSAEVFLKFIMYWYFMRIWALDKCESDY